jgi:predicted outer membrane repeat protein
MRWAVGFVLGLTTMGCSDKPEGNSPDPQPPPVVDGTTCELPDPPGLGAAGATSVGDGTAASCTAEALRLALEAGGSVDFDCGAAPVTIPIDATLLVRDGTRLDGAGLVTLDGGGAVRILETENQATVVLSGLTFQNGHSAPREGADDSGGAIQRGWQGHLYVVDCSFLDNVADGTSGFGGGAIATASSGTTTVVRTTFARNQAALGGAIHSMLSDLWVVESVFEDNQATAGDGGAIFTDGGYVPPDTEHGTYGGRVEICGTRFLGNTATSSAGAGFLYTYGIDQLVIHRSEFRDNRVTTADPGLGGAIRIDAQAFVSNTLFVGNQNAGQGGAVWMGRGPARFENVTFYANHTALWGGAISYGDQPITLQSCTLARNLADESSDALFGEAGAVTAYDTLLYDNGLADSSSRHCNHPLLGGHNLAYPATSDDACGSDLMHVDPILAADLQDLGGPTATLALAAGSPALDAGTDCPATDQRGEPRDPDACDLGAFELP